VPQIPRKSQVVHHVKLAQARSRPRVHFGPSIALSIVPLIFFSSFSVDPLEARQGFGEMNGIRRAGGPNG
jgi:hypothetical protein